LPHWCASRKEKAPPVSRGRCIWCAKQYPVKSRAI